ncbi:major facilitator superfamily transporter [Mytilinidion resinicola]|uniref:Major facilitator superfamily transporter n=1 Tax=Mytilinidion resinicola TaxID=574789 RepID=A0A6A6Z371_9PEZI|nr:major facilitator superfamily transporter [Mytilinidion resinicola]KAF2815268.1 major facilitator superfamily transporter [Mytilinidion resinicola]
MALRDVDSISQTARDDEKVDLEKAIGDWISDGEKESNPATVSIDAESDDDARSIHSIGNQTNVLSSKRLLVAFPTLSIALFVSFIDQTSVSTSIPAISADLNTGTATSWIGGSFLISSTAFQLINGRLSDIFGRKNCLLICLALLGIGDLLCGFAKSKEVLFAFRAIAGIGAGGVNSVAMIIVSDITTLENRGKFQGILGAIIALANGTGPFIGGALVEKTTWRWVFWIVPMLAIPAALVIFFFLPLRHDSGHYAAKVKKIDFGGVVLNLASVLLILIPLSGAGATYAWDSAFVIAMLTVGLCLAIGFVLYEWKIAPIPIMPVHLVRYPHCPMLYLQNFFTGICFFGNFFYRSIYFQSVLAFSPLESGALMLPLIILTSITSILSGQFMSRKGRYMPVVVIGFAIWTIGTGLKCAFSRSTKLWNIIIVLLIEGCGIGCTLQPTLVAILANSRAEDRAVSTGLRNFLRTVGGAFGLIVSGAILSNTLRTRLSSLPFMSSRQLESLTSSTYGLKELNLTIEETNLVLGAYMDGLKYIFIMYCASAGANFLMCAGIGNTDLKTKPKPVDTPTEHESGNSEELDDSPMNHGSATVEKETAQVNLNDEKSIKHEAT